jgi:hypothetical protein
MMANNSLEMLAYLNAQEREREWKMAALAAQLPRRSRRGTREQIAVVLRSIARFLDPDIAATTEHIVVELAAPYNRGHGGPAHA